MKFQIIMHMVPSINKPREGKGRLTTFTEDKKNSSTFQTDSVKRQYKYYQRGSSNIVFINDLLTPSSYIVYDLYQKWRRVMQH